MGQALHQIRKPSALGEQRIQAILKAAEKEFEQYSFGGARMQRIADKAGIPKPNVHYYFRSKLDLYNAVLEDVITLWDQAFETLNPDDDPARVLINFVRKKVEFTRLYPEATRIFTSEIMHGSPHMNAALNDKMSRWTRDRADVIDQWVKMGKIRPIDPYHLIFMIWATTQHFAFAEAQIKSVYQKSGLTRKDYRDQADSLVLMIERICGLDQD
jgi:TetR/AcrR family transcriptional regulator